MTRSVPPTRVDWLPNGMRVLTRELHHAPLASVMVWYGVGSRNETPGLTGISHFLEHMMFKGTTRFPSGVLEEAVKLRGGAWNAFTSYDYTAYYEVLPARHLEYGLEIEADRMVNMRFDPDLTVLERGIIVSEREGRENNPFTWLVEAFMHEVFGTFPYRHSIIGYKEDIRATTAAALTAHYQRYYRPNNATLVVVGDFETDRLLRAAENHFGPIPGGAPVEPLSAVEPEQTAERRVEVRRPGPNPQVLVGYRIPAADHPDQSALEVLGALMSGPSGFMRGGSGMGRSSRFYRNLVSKGIATSANGSPWALQYPGLFMLSAMPAQGVAPDRLEGDLLEQVEALKTVRVESEELDRAKKQIRASFTYGLESVTNQAHLLGATAMTQGVEAFDRALEMLEAVTAADVQRVAERYLTPTGRTVGWFIPGEAAKERIAVPAGKPAEETAGSTPDYQTPGSVADPVTAPGRPARIVETERVVRRELPGGAVLLTYPVETIPSLFIRVQMEAGPVLDPLGKAGLAAFACQLALRGTAGYTAEELALKTDAMGISIRADVGRETSVFSLKCLPEDLEAGLDLLGEVIRRPTFPEDELGRLRDRILVGIRQQNNDTRAVAAKRLSEALYPEHHPYRYPPGGSEESVSGLRREDFVEFHRQNFGPAGALISAVGNVAPERLEAAFRWMFDGWTGGAGRPQVPAAGPGEASESHIAIPGKTQTDIALGWPMVDRGHPDFLALEVLATLFGGNGLPASSRLFRDVREKYGLSYYQYAHFGASMGPAPWSTHIGVSPTRLDFALEVLKSELRRLTEEPPPMSELISLIQFLEDFPAVQHESPERLAARLAEAERFGLGLDYPDRYADQVRRLTPESLRAVAARHLDLSRIAVITAGPGRN